MMTSGMHRRPFEGRHLVAWDVYWPCESFSKLKKTENFFRIKLSTKNICPKFRIKLELIDFSAKKTDILYIYTYIYNMMNISI